TTQALSLLLQQGSEISFLTQYGRLKGRVLPLESKNLPLRLAQYERSKDEQFKLALAKAIVYGKIKNARTFLMKHDRSHNDLSLTAEAAALESSMQTVAQQDSLETVRGVEGQAAAVYFRALTRMLRRAVDFHGRTRQPPRDPVNALLSLGYTLLGNELLAVLSAQGFDPYLGFLHGISYGRPSLALDLLEEFRAPVVDRLTLALFNLAVLTPDDFQSHPQGGVTLKPKPLKRYLREYEEHLNRPFKNPATGQQTSFRRLLTIQARKLARVVKEGGEYEPFWSK
ncbi:MAG TPA: CRISPR-associated endonuclease Cas1, partial [Armatimonadetes bacterium]|nr:CRISPR-associated endonuclease Cas1 [Armatimonadota bacterium]